MKSFSTYVWMCIGVLQLVFHHVNSQSHPDPTPSEVHFNTSDSVLIYGDIYHLEKSKPVILLFHQAGANGRSEYAEIIPRLTDSNFNVLSIDQRSGGQRFGGYNRTVADLGNKIYSYCEAYVDLEAALDYLLESGYSGPKLLWGSSYSAALVVRLAHARAQDITGVIAFSPASGGPMKDCKADDLLADLEVPLLVMRPAKEMEIESVSNQFKLVQQHGHSASIVANGVHGSSMMVASRVEGGVDEQWEEVLTFINNCLK